MLGEGTGGNFPASSLEGNIIMGNALSELTRWGQSPWYDNIRRDIVRGGRLAQMVAEDGLRGVTSNPAIFEKAVGESDLYDGAVGDLVRQGVRSVADLYEHLAIEDIQGAADVLRPVYDSTEGLDGYVSFEVAPDLSADTAGTIAYAKRVHAWIARPNVLIKVPGTPEGMPAISELIASGISVNVTLLFSIDAWAACAEAYLVGLERLHAAGKPLHSVTSVASFFVSRIDALIDGWIDQRAGAAGAGGDALLALRGKAAVANAVIAYDRWKTLLAGERWRTLEAAGARHQRLLWASTSTKNPAYPKGKYVDDLIAPDTVNTIPDETWQYYREHGQPGAGLAANWDLTLASAKKDLAALAESGISLEAATTHLLADGVDKFVKAFGTLLGAVQRKRDALAA